MYEVGVCRYINSIENLFVQYSLQKPKLYERGLTKTKQFDLQLTVVQVSYKTCISLYMYTGRVLGILYEITVNYE